MVQRLEAGVFKLPIALMRKPALSQNSEFSGLEGALPGDMGRTMEAAEAFHKLGLSPEMAAKFAPIMSKFVETRGGSSTAALFEKALARVVAIARKADNCQVKTYDSDKGDKNPARLISALDILGNNFTGTGATLKAGIKESDVKVPGRG